MVTIHLLDSLAAREVPGEVLEKHRAREIYEEEKQAGREAALPVPREQVHLAGVGTGNDVSVPVAVEVNRRHVAGAVTFIDHTQGKRWQLSLLHHAGG